MKVIEAPNNLSDIQGKSVFLAGSIEMGVAAQWRQQVIIDLEKIHGTILNPRRKDWDSSWKQDEFVRQVSWELEALAKADLIAFYFDPTTKSPISLLELGLYARDVKPVYVCCPEGYWKKGNVDVVCRRYGVIQFSSLSDLTAELKRAMM